MSRRRVRIPIQVPVVLVLLTLAALSIYRWRLDQRGDPEHLVVSGTVEADQFAVGSKVGGRLLAVYAEEGAAITRGQTLAEFDAAELGAQIRQLEAGRAAASAQAEKLRNGPRVQELAQARAAVAMARAQLAELESGSRSEDIGAAEASWRAAAAQAELARADYGRAQELYDAAVIPASQLDAARTRMDTAEQNAAAAREQFEKAQSGPRTTQLEAARAALAQAQAAYDLLAAGSRPEDIAAASAQVGQAEAQLELAHIRLDEARVLAPADGMVLTANFEPGDLVLPNQPIFNVLLTDSYYVQVFVPENRLGWALPGRTARLHVDTYPSEEFVGTVTYLATQGEYTPRNLQTTEKRVEQTFRCKLTVADSAGKLRPGMICDVTFDKPEEE
jgi:HlyD family secretion protein